MNIKYPERSSQWSQLQKVLFRLIFTYLILYISPFIWFSELPIAAKLYGHWTSIADIVVSFANDKVFHIKNVLVPLNGSADTSFAWAQLCLITSLSIVACFTWTAIDSKRPHYNALHYWLSLFTRYNLAYSCLLYGITKIFLGQMATPGYSQLSTPLGDFSSQRLLWMFMGYSKPYQFFTGALEVTAGFLLLFRRTSALGTIMATGIFINVVMLNLCYNIPVKLLSIHLLAMCLFLLVVDYKRYLAFFISNTTAVSGNLYDISFPSGWMQNCRHALKLVLIILFVIFPTYSEYGYYVEVSNPLSLTPVEPGIYDVSFLKNSNDSLSNSMTWSEIAFDINGVGSINKIDSSFLIRYNRSYFFLQPDTIKHVLQFKKFAVDAMGIINLHYTKVDSSGLKLWGIYKADTLQMELRKSSRTFQLTQETLQWLSETSH